MDDSERDKLVKGFGAAGINTYVHLGCLSGYAKTPMKNPLKEDGVSYVIESVDFLPAEPLGGERIEGADHCDRCGLIFGEFDGRVMIRITRIEELRTLFKLL